ncbi:MAG TPA: hypothetical protein VG847_16415, partial [Chitinophagaceae bacterium]|nr:hypothetical protein [Chitinophagaceae bacterium]
MKKYLFKFILLTVVHSAIFAQYNPPLYASYTTTAEKTKLHDRLIKSIHSNLSVPLTDSTEENWEDAFDAIEVLLYHSPLSDQKIATAFDSLDKRTVEFQQSLLEMIYANYPHQFLIQVNHLLYNTPDTGVFALCGEYLLQQNNKDIAENVQELMNRVFTSQVSINPILHSLQVHIDEKLNGYVPPAKIILSQIFDRNFLEGNIVMYSIQRKDRDYPGLVLIKDRYGNFITDSSGKIFEIPQLARSITNLPFCLHYGNTPQGIYLMHGFQVSMANFIGPTANVQLSMPAEVTIAAFLRNDNITDSVWSPDYYKSLLPETLQNFSPLYEAYYAGLCGRREIIAHGTTIDPSYYLHQPYYPLTPSEGCLCTKEIWNGKRAESDQQKLVNALLRAGGADGYCIVIDIDDKKAPVTLKDVLPFILN